MHGRRPPLIALNPHIYRLLSDRKVGRDRWARRQASQVLITPNRPALWSRPAFYLLQRVANSLNAAAAGRPDR